MIQAGGDVNEQDERRKTPLHLASGKGYVEVITALLAAGGDKTIKDKGGKTPHDLARNQDIRNALDKESTGLDSPDIEYFPAVIEIDM